MVGSPGSLCLFVEPPKCFSSHHTHLQSSGSAPSHLASSPRGVFFSFFVSREECFRSQVMKNRTKRKIQVDTNLNKVLCLLLNKRLAQPLWCHGHSMYLLPVCFVILSLLASHLMPTRQLLACGYTSCIQDRMKGGKKTKQNRWALSQDLSYSPQHTSLAELCQAAAPSWERSAPLCSVA